MKKITEVTPYLFNDYLLISLDKKWISVLGLPKFEVFIDKLGKLTLRTKSVVNEVVQDA